MVYDTILFAEARAGNGYTGIAGVGPAPLAFTGDTVTLRKGFGTPVMVGLGSTGDTKPQGCRIKGNRSYGTNYIIGPGAEVFWPGGVLRDIAIPFQEGETITGEQSNTNVNEGSLVAMWCAYGGAHRWPESVMDSMSMAGGGELWIPPFSVTSAAAVTTFSGEVALDAATTDTGDQWLDTRANYYILGVVPSISAATFGGIMQVRTLPAQWNGYVPGIPVNALSAVSFTPNIGMPFCPAYEPIGPFSGDALPQVSMCATSAGAVTGGLVLLKK
jgi:hypothetical protein